MKRVIIALSLMAFGWLPTKAEICHETLIDPRILAIQARSSEILNTVPQTEVYQTSLHQYRTALMQILSGGEIPADLPMPAGISDAYTAAFLRYYTDSKTDQAVMTCFRLTTQTLDEKTMNEIAQYTERNLPTVLMTVFEPAQPIEEQNPNLTEFAVALITRISEWIHLYYPQYNTSRP